MSNLSRRLSVVAFVCIAVLSLTGGVAVADTDQQAGLLQQDIDADTVVLAADIDETGDANWTVEYRLRLEDETDEQAFDDLQADIAANESAYLDPFEQRIRDTARAGENATGRSMSVEQFDVSTERREQPQDSFGVVTFSFEWTGFAVVDGDAIRAGDAVEQLFLQEGERLEFSWPERYQLASSSPEPETVDERRVVWRGPIDFDAGQPQIELGPASESGSTALPFLLGAGALVVFAGVAVFYWRRQEDTESGGDQPVAATDDTPSTGETAAAGESDDTPPQELLSNEEQVLQLLDENGGRMKQKALADELDWSAAKTSQVVGDLREDDRLESFRLGRENVLTLPDVDLEESPDDDQ